jgi:DnaJ-class molecular chaperone
MNKYQKITEARQLLDLPESATMEQIKSHYRAMLSKWHPDKSMENQSNARNDSEDYRSLSDDFGLLQSISIFFFRRCGQQASVP